MMRRTILLLSAVALVLASCGPETDEGQDAEPTGSPEASPTTTLGPSPSGAGGTSSTGLTVADLRGAWIGVLVEPAVRTSYALRVTIGRCAPDVSCGRLRIAAVDYAGTGEPLHCEGELTFEGFQEDLGAFAFQETIESGPCADALLAVVPMPGAYAVGVEEHWEGAWASFGALMSADYHTGYP
jgi:hypothetical protein